MKSFDHLKTLSQPTLTDLCQAPPALQTSLIMPTIRAGREVRQNAIRFKNLLQEASEQAEAFGTKAKELLGTLRQCESLIDDDDWWQHQDHGLVLLADAAGFDCIRLPNEPSELISTGPVPYVRPLIKSIQDDSRFHILAVSQNRVRLFEASKSSVSELQPKQLPKDLQSALAIDEYTSSLQHHSSNPSIGKEGTVFHGHGGSGMEVQKNDELRLYFQKLNQALQNEPQVNSLPLIFAGVEYLFPIFRETCHHPHLISEPLTGNPDEERPESLRDRGWSMLSEQFDASLQNLVKQIDITGESGTTAIDIGEILAAAQQGAIETLLVSEDEHLWGVLDESTGNITARLERVNNDDRIRGAQELINLAAVRTIATGGNVYIHSSRDELSPQKAIAVLRFAVTHS